MLVNNAGGSSFMGPFTELRFRGWEKVMRLNVDAIVHLSQAVGRHMLERRTGSVVNVASVAGLKGTPQLAPYGASKAAVISLTRSLALEWGTAGVRVNALCPGWTQHRPQRAAVGRRGDGRAPRVGDRAEALGRRPRRWSGRRCSWPATPAASSPGRRWWSTAAELA